ncbi:acyl-CoA reductase-like NAD-dependent aldehyde dehydrogenase [Desulfobotulus alkaliphilus]|uniref:Acyl-CoA reductase-like NAD-dependent aldehyde dehydrogenase n=1 Tax=Desulfobotulus alkaliphilus TaxID=622671 RepID=A0A562RVN5_9BACT|nr:aldehyde dehydrogenase family protein [Desulfobotulus alkaliphilus]TWI73028.1 acyl-CoA reductase-like NAD-dependent aldehyde dehydrogenase [Desulfobotulus alkaliphilus]
MTIIDNDLLSIQKARILAENALEGQKRLATFPQEQLDEIVESVARAVVPHVQTLAAMSCEETEYGRWEDKCLKNSFVCEDLPMRMRGMRCVGIIGHDRASGLAEIGVPVGVIAALCPATSPVSTTIYKTLIAIKSGNAIVFSPHPRAIRSMGRVLDIMMDAAASAGLPEGCLSWLDTVTHSGTLELMGHRATSLILNTGVSSLLSAAYAARKPVIYGGMGNGPAFIERTADIEQAVRDIIASKTFDNGIVSSAEQSIVVDGCIDREVRQALVNNGAWFMTEEQSRQFTSMFFCPNGKPNQRMIGLDAQTLALRAGFSVPDHVKVLVAGRSHVSETDPYAGELLCPVLAYYVEDDWMHACEKCIELLIDEGTGHTLVIHSRDENVICQFALKKPVGRVLVNTPGSFGGMGFTTSLFPSMTLGSGSAGEGITSDNVSPMNLIYIRKVGYGVRRMDAMENYRSKVKYPSTGELPRKEDESSKSLQTLHRILKEAIRVMDRP